MAARIMRGDVLMNPAGENPHYPERILSAAGAVTARKLACVASTRCGAVPGLPPDVAAPVHKLEAYRITDEFPDAPEAPPPAVRGQSLVAVFGHGRLSYQPERRWVVCVSANPFRFFCHDLAASDPVGTRHENADFAAIMPGPADRPFGRRSTGCATPFPCPTGE